MDSELLGQLLDRHADALELYARQWCDTPEDIVQEAFVKLAAQRVPPDDPAAWLFRVVRNAGINAATAARRRRRHETAARITTSAWFQADTSGHADAVDPETAQAELAALPIEQREVIVARLWGGLTFEQVAAVAGCSTSQAHRLYQAGLNSLRERLGVPCRSKSRPIPG
jgi:RNA polymerase sigma factor (sigma-70 family)